MEKSSFFNAELKGGKYDRVYLAEDYANYFKSFIGNGVFPNPTTNLQVIANRDMTVTLKSGKAWINGYMYENTDNYLLNVEVADGVLNRIDRVVIRLDFINREIKSYIKKGTFASSPVAPTIIRNGDMYELALADIYVAKGITSITQTNVTDLRLNIDLCGIVHGTVEQVDTTAIFNQYQSWYSQNTQAFLNQFNEWFETIKGSLEGDVAVNLSNEVNNLKIRTTATEKSITLLDTTTKNTIKEIEEIQVRIKDYNSFASSIDLFGVYKVVEYKRANGTLYMKSILSGGTAPRYTQDSWTIYNEAGTSVIATKNWTITYDTDGNIVSKVVR